MTSDAVAFTACHARFESGLQDSGSFKEPFSGLVGKWEVAKKQRYQYNDISRVPKPYAWIFALKKRACKNKGSKFSYQQNLGKG